MWQLRGSSLVLTVEEPLLQDAVIAAGSARDSDDGLWLVAGVRGPSVGVSWYCAPVSERALEALLSARASVWDVLHHSLTGLVEVVVVGGVGEIADRCLRCADLPPALARWMDRRPAIPVPA